MEALPHAAVALATFSTGGLYFLFVRARLWRTRALSTEAAWRQELDAMREQLDQAARTDTAGSAASADPGRVDELEDLVRSLDR